MVRENREPLARPDSWDAHKKETAEKCKKLLHLAGSSAFFKRFEEFAPLFEGLREIEVWAGLTPDYFRAGSLFISSVMPFLQATKQALDVIEWANRTSKSHRFEKLGQVREKALQLMEKEMNEAMSSNKVLVLYNSWWWAGAGRLPEDMRIKIAARALNLAATPREIGEVEEIFKDVIPKPDSKRGKVLRDIVDMLMKIRSSK